MSVIPGSTRDPFAIPTQTLSTIATPRQLAAAPYALGMRGMYAVWADNGFNESFNVVGGAQHNSVATGVFGATIGGGGGLLLGAPGPNTVTGDWGTVGGGYFNTAGDQATVSGGIDNVASGTDATVGGGASNSASRIHATVSGGIGNTASGISATVGGGLNNSAIGDRSAIPGGHGNSARGNAGFAAGYRARSVHDGTFVWNDRSIITGNDSLVSTGPNQFLIRAAGGVGIGTNAPNREVTIFDGDDDGDAVLNLKATNPSPRELFVGVNQSSGGIISMVTNNDLQFRTNGTTRVTIEAGGDVGIATTNPSHPLHVGTDATNGNGAHLLDGGVWTNGSSRTFKSGLEEIDKIDVLERLAALPVTKWRYRGADESEHIGPTAEDFREAFGLGHDERYITTVDADGVALAGIQGLYEVVLAQQQRIAVLEARLTP